MLALEKIISSFLMPPGFFIIILLIITIYLFLKSDSKLIKFLAAAALIFLVFISTAFGVKVMLLPLENYAEEISLDLETELKEEYPIVVLGGGNYYKSDGSAEPSVHSKQRLTKAYQLQRIINTKIIYSGGVGIGHDNFSEADAAKEFLLGLGLEREKYESEDQARSTYENALYTKKWLNENEIEKVYLVTSAYHIYRSAGVFRAQEIDFIALHSGFIYDHQFSWLNYLPNRGALQANLAALHELVGIVWYYLRARI